MSFIVSKELISSWWLRT